MFLHPHTTKLIIFARKIAYIMKSIRKYPVSLFLIAAIWTVCLIPIPETPLNDVPMMDKWTHFVMFGVLSLCIISEYVYRHRKPKGWNVALVGMLLPFAMGATTALGGNIMTDAFGLVALVAMMPLITVQVMGAIYVIKTRRVKEQDAALDLSDEGVIELWEVA